MIQKILHQGRNEISSLKCLTQEKRHSRKLPARSDRVFPVYTRALVCRGEARGAFPPWADVRGMLPTRLSEGLRTEQLTINTALMHV